MMSVFRPPIVRTASEALDKSLFTKRIPLAAARIINQQDISEYRRRLDQSQELLKLERLRNVLPDPDPSIALKGGKCLLLKPDINPGDTDTWSHMLKEAVEAQRLGVIAYDLDLDYSYWTYHDIMTSVLPEDAQEEIPAGFTVVGHVAHLNLRDEYLPYKKLVAEVIVDKNPGIKTVINKVDNVGIKSEYRTFSYEVLAGEDDLNVEQKEQDCIFRFNYSKVYWNTRLGTEHERLVSMFNTGEAVCDLMAGVGPFAVPAGKRGVFVSANDLNPDSYASLKRAITDNKVGNFVIPFNQDGHTFIQVATDALLRHEIYPGKDTLVIQRRARRGAAGIPKDTEIRIKIPSTFHHFVMNLPATAIDFLGSFIGLYHGHESYFEPITKTKLPMIHAHCFSTKSEDNVKEAKDICQRISDKLGYQVKPDDKEMVIHEVRDVAPNKRMFCASFRLPAEVAFRQRHSK